ncbi:MAG TPA: serine hydrolase, partial [Bacteroidota bacterium]|nr:serine hydrolase [Bacteroidota bacterium]
MIRRLHFLMPFFLPALCLANMPTGNASAIIEEIKKLEQEFGGHLGVMAKNLATGDVVAYRADERFPTASAIKFPVMTAFFHLVDQKKIDPQEKVVLHDRDKKQGSGILQLLSEGSSLTLLDAVRLMITLSDNTATNLV